MSFTTSDHSIAVHTPAFFKSAIVAPNDTIRIAYTKYQANNINDSDNDKPTVNLIFAHMASASKAVWIYHIAQLFSITNNTNNHTSYPFKFNTIIAYDAAAHGDSNLLNHDKLGISHSWLDNYDHLLAVVEAEKLQYTSDLLIAVGHSFGGFASLLAGYLRPQLFDSIVVAEPMVSRKYGLKGGNKSVAMNDKAKVGATSTGGSSKSNEGSIESISKAKFNNAVWIKVQSDFNSKEEAWQFLNTLSFYKKAPLPVKEAIFEKEFYKEEKTNRYIRKTCLSQSRASFTPASRAMPFLYNNLKYFELPVCHVAGTVANWIPKSDIEDVRNTLRIAIKENSNNGKGDESGESFETADMVGKGHTCCLDGPDEFVEIVLRWVTKRATILTNKTKNSSNGEEQSRGRKMDYTEDERKRIFSNWEKEYLNGKLHDPFWDPKPKL